MCHKLHRKLGVNAGRFITHDKPGKEIQNTIQNFSQQAVSLSAAKRNIQDKTKAVIKQVRDFKKPGNPTEHYVLCHTNCPLGNK